MQWDDPLDAIAVHAWNGLWGVIAVGMFAAPDLITNSYGTGVFDGAQRPYGFVFSGSDGHLLCAQIAYALFITSAFPQPLCPIASVSRRLHSCFMKPGFAAISRWCSTKHWELGCHWMRPRTGLFRTCCQAVLRCAVWMLGSMIPTVQ